MKIRTQARAKPTKLTNYKGRLSYFSDSLAHPLHKTCGMLVGTASLRKYRIQWSLLFPLLTKSTCSNIFSLQILSCAL